MTRSAAQRRSWRDPETRRRRIAGLRRKWRSDADYAERVRTKFLRWIASAEGRAHLSRNGKRTILLGRGGRFSRPEAAMAMLLRARDIPFEAHVRFGVWTADFVLPGKVVIEVDDPRFHTATKERDARKDADLRKRGYMVRRVSAEKVLRATARREMKP